MRHSPGFLKIAEEARARVREMTPHDVLVSIERGSAQIVDVREESEWANGRLPRAIHLSKGVLERDIERTIPNKGKSIILYCGGGYRSALAADAIRKMGYDDVRSMAGGFRAWQDAGYPVVK